MPQSWLALPPATRAEGGDRSFALLLDDWCRAFDRSASGRSGAYAGACAFRSPCGPRYAGARSSDGGQRKACRGPPRRSAASARDSGPYHPAVCGKTTTEGSTAERSAGQSTGADGRVRPCRASPDAPRPRLSSQKRVGHRQLSDPGMQIQGLLRPEIRGCAAFVSTSSISLVRHISREQRLSSGQCRVCGDHIIHRTRRRSLLTAPLPKV